VLVQQTAVAAEDIAAMRTWLKIYASLRENRGMIMQDKLAATRVD